jgi:hypothetical protein
MNDIGRDQINNYYITVNAASKTQPQSTFANFSLGVMVGASVVAAGFML